MSRKLSQLFTVDSLKDRTVNIHKTVLPKPQLLLTTKILYKKVDFDIS